MSRSAQLGNFRNRLELYDSSTGNIDVEKTAEFLEISVSDLANIFGVTRDQIRPDRVGPKTRQRIEQLAGALEAVADSFGGDIAKTKFWIKTPNPHFGYISPRNLILKGRHTKVLKFINSVLHAD